LPRKRRTRCGNAAGSASPATKRKRVQTADTLSVGVLQELSRNAGVSYATTALAYLGLACIQPGVLRRLAEAAEELQLPLPPSEKV
jgi:hypothetical protein